MVLEDGLGGDSTSYEKLSLGSNTKHYWYHHCGHSFVVSESMHFPSHRLFIKQKSLGWL